MSDKTRQTVRSRAKDGKRKERGCIRERRWTDVDGNEKTTWQADLGTVNGKRLRKLCETKAKAEQWLHEQGIQLQNQGHAAFVMNEHERVDAMRALAELAKADDPTEVKNPQPACLSSLPKLAPLETTAKAYATAWKRLHAIGTTIEDAVDFVLKHRPTNGERRTVAQAIDEYVADAKANNLRPASIRSLFYRLQKMAGCIGERPINEITSLDADKWIDSLTLSPMSKKHHRTIAHGLFNFAIDKGYYGAENPFATKRHRRKYHADEIMPECMQWRDVQKVMASAVEHEPSMIPALAIGFFAGVRTSELQLMDWQQIDLVAGRITVLPAVAKRRRARHITMEPNLVKWLMPHRQEKGMVAPEGEKWRSRLDSVREKAKVEWPHNAMRHSYASHHLVKYNDAARTALQLGHGRDVSMLFEHYRSVVTPEDAAAYFDIQPTAKDNVIQMTQAG